MVKSKKSRTQVEVCAALRLLLLTLLLLTGFGGTALADDATAKPSMDTDGYYLLTSAADLQWFATQVNNGETINAKQTANIDLSALSGCWTSVGTATNPFKGKFDGGGMTISGLKIQSASNSGLFGVVSGASIANVTISGASNITDNGKLTTTAECLGIVVGKATDSQISGITITQGYLRLVEVCTTANRFNCVGGICGQANGSTSFSNCSVEVKIDGYGNYTGGVVGLMAGGCTVKGSVISATTSIIAHDYVGCVVGCVNGRPSDKVVSNKDNEVKDGARANSYTGKSGVVCGGSLLTDEPELIDGNYEIYTYGQLKTFSAKVNGGDNAINGKVMADITGTYGTTEAPFIPIGSSEHPFTGNFDGQNYTISGLVVNSGSDYAGLFGYVAGGEMRNVYLDGSQIILGGNYSGCIAGYVTKNGDKAGSIVNCHVTNATVNDGTTSVVSCLGGIVGKTDNGATITGCSFKGIFSGYNVETVGGIAGELASNASLTDCFTTGYSLITGTNNVGGIVGVIADGNVTLANSYLDNASETITINASADAASKGNIWGKNNTSVTNVNKTYTEGGLVYELTGKQVSVESGKAAEVKVTGIADTSMKSFHVYTDIGSWNDYFTSQIVSLKGTETVDFCDNVSNIAGTEACGWPSITINDYAFDSNFKGLYMKYTMYAGDDHVVALRPGDVQPAGTLMFANCPDAKVYVDADYYDAFVADPMWSNYKSNIVAVTDFREANFTEEGVHYAYNRNFDATGSIVTKEGNNGTNVTMVHVIGCDNDKIANNSGLLKIYQDIGETYAYNTTHISVSAFKGNEGIQTVKFHQIMKLASSVYTDYNITIGDYAFANCKNLHQFNVVLYSDDDTYHYVNIDPSQMPIGKGVFDGCADDFKIRIPAAMVDAFRADANWSQYSQYFEAVDFLWPDEEEAGVQYSYCRSDDGKTYYTNKDAEAMEAYVTPWISKYRNFKPSSVLVPDNENNVYYVIASGVNNDNFDSDKGELKIYNDIGTSYNYKTIALSSTGFQNNSNIKSIVFEDCASNVSNANTQLSLVIPDETFKGCTNLKELNMYYLATDGTNRYEAIKPSEIFIGENVFSGVGENFRIHVLPDLYDDFLRDANWSQYKDYIVASDYLPVDKDPIVKEGITYDYAAKALNTIPTSETTRMQTSLWNIPIIAVEIYQVASLIQSIASSVSAIKAMSASQNAMNEYNKAAIKYVNKHSTDLFPDPDGSNFDVNILNPAREFRGLDHAISRIHEDIDVITDWLYKMEWHDDGYHLIKLVGFEADALNSHLVGLTTYMNRLEGISESIAACAEQISMSRLSLLRAITPAAMNIAANYVVGRTLKNFAKNPTWTINGANWVETETRTNVPHMYVKSVADDVTTATIYADPGYESASTLRYRTVDIDSNAFRNRKNLRTVQFQDRQDRVLSYDPLVLSIPDSCFAGCDNLETIDLVIKSICRPGWTSYDKRYKSLTPDNFIPTGHDIFAGLDTTKVKIRVGNDVLQEFKDDDYWGKYSGMFVGVDVEDVIDFTALGANYSLTYDNNTIPLETQVGSHDIDHVDIVSADDESLNDDNGRLYLINDYGIFNNYKLDNIKSNAFKDNTNLKSIEIVDKYSVSGEVYTDFNITIGDYAFANCKNLRDVELLYPTTGDDFELVKLSPYEISLGKGVFDGCDNLRLKFDLNKEAYFNFYSTWAEYKDKFAPCFFEPQDSKVLELLEDYKYMASTNLVDYDYIDATLASPDELKNLFSGTDIETFDEFRAFGTCGLNTVYSGMFRGCSKLQSIKLPTSILSIESEAFKGNELLAKLTIPVKVSTIGADAFNGSNIKSFFVTNPVPAEGDIAAAFRGLPEDYVIYVADSVLTTYKQKWAAVADHINSTRSYRSMKEVDVKTPGTLASELGLVYDYDNQTLTGNYAQYDSLRVSGTLDGRDIGVLRYMGGRDVENCEPTAGHLTYLDLYDANLKKGDWEYNRKGINDYIQEDNHVDDYMFWRLDKLQTLILPKSATRICKDAAAECASLATLVVGDGVTDVEKDIVAGSKAVRELVMLPRKKPTTDEDAWDIGSDNVRLSQISAPKSAVAEYSSEKTYFDKADTIFCSFHDDAVLEAMTRHHVFTSADFSQLSNINGIVNDQSAIGEFNELMNTAVSSLGTNSLSGMTGLEEVALPLYLDSISADAFSQCVNLKKVWALGAQCPSLAKDAFADLPSDFVIMVAEGDEAKYRTAWPQYKEHIQGFHFSNTIREVTVTEPNTLAAELGFTVTKEKFADGDIVKSISGDMSGITALKVNGPLGTEDIAVLRMLGGRDPYNNDRVYVTNMNFLDIYNTDIRKETDNPVYFGTSGDFADKIDEDDKTPVKMLGECDNLETVILPRTATTIDGEGLYNMYSLRKVVVGDNTTSIGDDVFGDDDNLTTIAFLCKSKPTLDGDAFTDPFLPTEDVFKVENMYVCKSLINDYTSDKEYTSHANNISSAFDDDDLFRAFGSRGYITADDITTVKSVNGWFKNFSGITDLCQLKNTIITELDNDDLSSLVGLQRVSLPATMSTIADGAFTNNTNLHWLDLSECDTLKSNDINKYGACAGAIVYVPESFGEQTSDNVVYVKSGALQCAKFNLVSGRDYDVPKAFTAKAVNFDRTFSKDGKYMLTLPFTAEVPSGLKAYKLKSDADSKLTFRRVAHIEANKPYVLCADADTQIDIDDATEIEATPARTEQYSSANYTMIGTLSKVANADAVAMKAMTMADNAQWSLLATDSEADVAPFTAYMQVKNATAATSGLVSEFEDYTDVSLNEDADNSEVIKTNEGEYVNANLTRTLKTGGWNTFCVPFTTKVKGTPLEGAAVLGVASIEGNAFTFEKVDSLKAGEPYLIKPTSNIANPTFAGVKMENTIRTFNGTYDFLPTYSPMTIDNTKTTFFLSGDNKLKLAKEGTKLNGLRAYFKSSSANNAMMLLYLDNETITAIDGIEEDASADSPSAIYGVDGIYKGNDLNVLPRGVYIMNGMKIIK